MDTLSALAASGLRSRMESLDMLANNLANSATNGYKLDREFYSLYSGAASEDPSPDPSIARQPVLEKPWTDFSQGALQTTGNPQDLALAGKGFFTVNGPAGPLYTRNGNFQVASDGRLLAADGYPVAASGGGTIQLQSGKPFEVTSDGTVRQGGATLGQLQLVEFPAVTNLTKAGNNYYQNPDPKIQPVPATGAQVNQGKLENSNVSTAESAVRLVTVMRQFEMLQKAIAVGSEMNKHTIEEVARVNP
jgi:flagellar basal-body rod protein FlgF